MGVFAAWKKREEQPRRWLLAKRHGAVVQSSYPTLVRQFTEDVLNPATIINSFRATGLWPVDKTFGDTLERAGKLGVGETYKHDRSDEKKDENQEHQEEVKQRQPLDVYLTPTIPFKTTGRRSREQRIAAPQDTPVMNLDDRIDVLIARDQEQKQQLQQKQDQKNAVKKKEKPLRDALIASGIIPDNAKSSQITIKHMKEYVRKNKDRFPDFKSTMKKEQAMLYLLNKLAPPDNQHPLPPNHPPPPNLIN